MRTAEQTESLILVVWFIGCAVGGQVLVAIGARAAGLALLGAVAGAIVGSLLVSSQIDLLPHGAMVGATIGTFVGGPLGLAWRAWASVVLLCALGGFAILAGVLCVVAGWLEAARPCHPGGPSGCMPDVHSGALTLFALDAAWGAAVCFIQAAQSKPIDATEQSPVDGHSVADARSR